MDMLALWGVYLLEGMFVVGLLGSAVVVLVTSVEDVQELFGADEPAEAKPGER
jgi:nucleoside diphosphate kinase